MTLPTNKPPFIQTRGLRLLLETERPERFLRPEYFRAGRGAGPALAQRDVGTWFAVDRHDVARNCVTDEKGAACDLSRLVVTTDAGVGKTTEMHWLEAELNQPGGQTAAFFLTFGQLPSRAEQLIDDVLVPRLLYAGTATNKQDEGGKNVRRVLESLRDQGRLVLVLDALDQAPSDGPAVEVLGQLLADPRWRRCRIVLSARPHALQRHWTNVFATQREFGWRFVQLDEFDEQEQRRFLGQDDAGQERFELVPTEAREILSTPRVLEYLHGLPDADLKQIQTAGDVYWLSVQHLLTEGMRNSEAARQVGLAAQEMTPANVQARSLRRARQLLGAIAFEMTSTLVVRRDAEGEEQRVPNFDGVRRGTFERFRKRLLQRLSAASSAADAQLLDRDLDGLAALNDFVSQGFFDTVEGLQENFWRNRTLQEFFTAYWLSQGCSQKDAKGLWHWIYLPEQPLSEEYYWVWRFLCEMHEDALDPESWTRAIEPIFRAGDGTADGTKRSSEIIYRAWKPINKLARDGEARAREVLDGFLGEFQREILSGNRDEELQQIAQQFRDQFLEMPSGQFHMGAPPEKQGVPDDLRQRWQDFLDQDGEPSRRAESLVSELYTFTPGKRGQDERQNEIDWWTRVFRERDLDSVIQRQYPGDETPEKPIQWVATFLLSRWPTINTWYRLFAPEHGEGDSYYRKKYAEISSARNTPVIFVSWYDAWAFCKWAHWDGTSCRLPREYEWEYAAKAGTVWQQNYWWGDDFVPEKCNGDSRIGHTTPPTAAHANPWGLVDMLGNVLEWTADEYRESYDREKLPDSSARVLRGGSWDGYAYRCRSAFRGDGHPSSSDNVIGFRVARANRKT